MTILIKILTAVYILAINVYAFILIKIQKQQDDECSDNKVRDSKLLITALLGGATGIFVSVFVFKHRLNSMFIMVIMPVLIVLNAYTVYAFVTGGFGLFEVTASI